uniref:Uncharacterized protein orf235 n=1 Tax=Bradyrhizobium japonicum TaxID=375 RepID=Q9JMW6_BRAJP|nr:unknown [Bradyrhizobium japonicum]
MPGCRIADVPPARRGGECDETSDVVHNIMAFGSGAGRGDGQQRRSRCRAIRARRRKRPLQHDADPRGRAAGSTPAPARVDLHQERRRLGLLRGARRACRARRRDRPAPDRSREAEGTARGGTDRVGKIDEALPKSDPLKKADPKSPRATQDRDPAAERPGRRSCDVVPGKGLASADRHGQPRAEGRVGEDLSLSSWRKPGHIRRGLSVHSRSALPPFAVTRIRGNGSWLPCAIAH